MKRTWIHFIGKKYYTITEFKKEAVIKGISRAIAPKIFKKMEFGDLILLAQKDGKSSKIFGAFIFSRIVGLDSEIIYQLQDRGFLDINQASDDMPEKIDRGCGSYYIQKQFNISFGSGLMQELRKIDDKKLGKVMIGGVFLELPEALQFPLGHYYKIDYILSDIPFQMGYRRIDFESLRKEVNEKCGKTPKRKGHLKLKGQFYADQNQQTEHGYVIDNPKLLEISNYVLN